MKNTLSTIRRWLMPLPILLVLASQSLVLAQTKVVVIPMSGDDLKPLQNIISVAKQNGDFNDPMAALSSINDANVNNPYLVVIAPGIYDLGNATLTLKPFVSVQGSGKDITIIRSQAIVEDSSTVRLVENSALGHLTIVQEGNPATTGEVFGVIAQGENFRLHSCKIDARNPSFRAAGFAMDDAQQGLADGVVDNVEIIVAGAFDRGLDQFGNSFFSDEPLLVVKNSRFTVVSTGTAIARLGFSNEGRLVVSDTVIELLGAGIGISNTDGDDNLYQNIVIVSDADNARALSGAGSGFRPNIENSHIKLTGAGSIAAITNNGGPVIRNSYVEAQTIFSRTSQTVFTPTYRVDNSILKGFRIASHNFADGNMIVRLGATKLDSFTFFDPGAGTIDASCGNSYDRNYAPLDENCE